MGRYIEQTEAKSELQQRLVAEMRAKAAARAKDEAGKSGDTKPVDHVDDAAYLRGTKPTTSLAWVWVLIFFAVIALFVYFVIRVNSQT